MNFVRISRASDNPKTAPKGRHNIGRGVSPCFIARQQTKPETGDTTKLYVPPRWGSIGIIGLFTGVHTPTPSAFFLFCAPETVENPVPITASRQAPNPAHG